MKSWKNQWKAELNNAISDKCSVAPVKPTVKNNGGAIAIPRKRILISSIAVALALMIGLGVFLGLFYGRNKSSSNLLALEINPKVVFVLDSNNVVTEVSSINFDADVILSDEDRVDQMVGKPVEEAVNAFVDYAINLGYMDEDGDTMTVTGVDELTTKIKDNLTKYLNDKQANVIVSENKTTLKEFSKFFGEDVYNNVDDIVEKIKHTPRLFADKNVGEKTLEELNIEYKNYVKSQIKKNVELFIKNDKFMDEGLKNLLLGLLEEDDFISLLEGMVEQGHLHQNIIPPELNGLLNDVEILSVEDYKNKMNGLANHMFNDLHGKYENPKFHRP